MADQSRAVTAAFPPPPPFWKHFTTANLRSLEEIKGNTAKRREGKLKKRWSPSELQALDIPPELCFLVPPEVPTSGQYSVFGETQNLSTALPSLKEQGIEQLYPSPPTDSGSQPSTPSNHAYYLLKISKSLLLNFLEFVGILSASPEQFEDKLEDLRNLFINAHHLLNLYRPHQARESLILMMEEQLEQTKEEIQKIDCVKERVEGLLNSIRKCGADAASLVQPATRSAESTDLDPSAVEEARQIWALLNDEVIS